MGWGDNSEFPCGIFRLSVHGLLLLLLLLSLLLLLLTLLLLLLLLLLTWNVSN